MSETASEASTAPITNTPTEIAGNSPADAPVNTPVENTPVDASASANTPVENTQPAPTSVSDTLVGDTNTNVDYGFEVGKFDTDTSIKEFSDFANSIGLSKEQAIAIRDHRDTGKATKADTSSKSSLEGINRLKAEYGDKYDSSIANAKDVVGKLGIDGDTMKTLESQLGTYGVLSLFTKLGAKLGGEAKFTTGSNASIKSAEQGIEDLRSNKDFMATYNDEGSRGYAKARAKMTGLYNKLYPAK